MTCKTKSKNYIKFLQDVLINVLSSTLLAMSLQLIIFPFLSSGISTTEFGTLIAIYGVNNLIVNFLGNSLNNIRLINRQSVEGYNLILYIINTLSVILVLISINILSINISVINLILFCIFTFLANNRNYFMVNYRLKLQYNKILKLNILIILGYFLGLLLYMQTGLWSIIFLSGEIFAAIYMFITNALIINVSKDEFKFNKAITLDFIKLSFSNFINNFLNYIDRFLIIPILGPASMGIYFAASAISKIIIMILTPINNVLLSHITNLDMNIKRSRLILLYLISLLFIFPLYFIINSFSNFLVDILYINLADEARKLIPIITIGILFNTVTNLLNNFLLKKYPITYQTIIQFVYGTVYLMLAILLSTNFGLKGFAYSLVIANITKYLMHILIVLFVKQNKEEN